MPELPHFNTKQYFTDAMNRLYDDSREDTRAEALAAAHKIVNKLGGYIVIKPECRRTKSGIIEIACLPEGYALGNLYG